MNEYDLVAAMKKAGEQASDAKKPVTVEVGTVITANPIKIQTESKLPLSSMQLIIPESLTKHDVTLTYDLNCSEELDHEHKIKGTTKVTIDNSLKVGDKVILIRQNGGQKYVVLDRTV
jgi:hypothetical protein